MKKILLVSLWIAGLFSCTHPSSYREDFVRIYFEKYPESTLQDIYKGSFQDIFGPAHILTDREAVTQYIKYEIETAEAWEEGDYTPCGWQGKFYQVNLKVIADGRVPMDDFVDAFMASAPKEAPQVTEKWVTQWTAIENVVRELYPHLYNLDADSRAINEMLSQGKYVMHHSRRYNASYHPHYRIIRKDVFERDILPLLSK